MQLTRASLWSFSAFWGGPADFSPVPIGQNAVKDEIRQCSVQKKKDDLFFLIHAHILECFRERQHGRIESEGWRGCSNKAASSFQMILPSYSMKHLRHSFVLADIKKWATCSQEGSEARSLPVALGVFSYLFFIFYTQHFEFCAWHSWFTLTSSDNDCWLLHLYIFIPALIACEYFPFLIKCICTILTAAVYVWPSTNFFMWT